MHSYLFLFIFVLLTIPKIVEVILDMTGQLAIPQDELMPRYLALVAARKKLAREKAPH